MKRIRNAIWNLFIDIGVAVIPRLSRRLMLCVAHLVGWLYYNVGFHARRVALENTAIVFGKPRPDLVKKSFATFAAMILEIFWSRRLNAKSIEDVVEIDPEGWEIGQSLLRRGKGVIAVNLHFSNWEMMGMALAYRGVKINYIAVPTKNPKMDEVLNGSRLLSGLQIIWRKGAGVGLLRALKRGQVISMMMDINVKPTDGGIWVDFFGLPVCVSGLTATLAQRTGASMVGTICVSQPDGKYRVVFSPELTCRADEDPREVTQRLMRWAEEVVCRYPQDCWWVYKRWKYRPADTKLPYPFYSKVAPEHAVPQGPPAEKGSL